MITVALPIHVKCASESCLPFVHDFVDFFEESDGRLVLFGGECVQVNDAIFAHHDIVHDVNQIQNSLE